jgi:hypothetical protein
MPEAEDPKGYIAKDAFLKSEAAFALSHLSLTYYNPLDGNEKTRQQKERKEGGVWVGHQYFLRS